MGTMLGLFTCEAESSKKKNSESMFTAPRQQRKEAGGLNSELDNTVINGSLNVMTWFTVHHKLVSTCRC